VPILVETPSEQEQEQDPSPVAPNQTYMVTSNPTKQPTPIHVETSTLYWNSFPTDIQQVYISIGYNEQSWNAGEKMAVNDKTWDNMELHERLALHFLGFTRQSWDGAALGEHFLYQPDTTIVVATPNPTPDPTRQATKTSKSAKAFSKSAKTPKSEKSNNNSKSGLFSNTSKKHGQYRVSTTAISFLQEGGEYSSIELEEGKSKSSSESSDSRMFHFGVASWGSIIAFLACVGSLIL